ncbi:MAG: pyridoxamine 5'-phosphate oxidase [Ginsengibacter sp.]
MPSSSGLESIRKDYRLQSLLEKDVDAYPIKQFETWWQHAIESAIDEPNAMTLSTSTPDGKPSSRIVLLKGISDNGFVFYTNYHSRKGRQIEVNPFVSIVFFWKELERQVRIEGEIKKISSGESDEYFSKRPLESRIGAWSSPQSSVIVNRELLDKNVADYTNKFVGSQHIPRPPHWGGYIVTPTLVEFWQGRRGRLHDRLQYTPVENDTWQIERLAP